MSRNATDANFGAVGSAWLPSAARLLQTIAGADKGVLDRVPEDRSRYTAMGAAVLGTALLGTLSMTLALTQVFDGFSWSILLIVPLWGVFVLNLDRWLVLTPMGEGLRGRLKVATPRILLAALFGIVIAEPLLLGIFSSAIEERVVTTRQTSNLTIEDRLRTCNPLPEDSPEAQAIALTSSCHGFRIAVVGDPRSRISELQALTNQANQLRPILQTDQARLADLNDLARRECNGDAGPGLTGIRGVAGECTRLRREADTFSAVANIGPRTTELADLDGRITDLSRTVGDEGAAYKEVLAQRIREEVARREEKQGTIGLLERFEAFDALRSENQYVTQATTFLRIFLILVDCVPILLKVLAGRTVYDALVERRRERRRRVFLARESNSEQARLNEVREKERDLRADDAASRARAGVEERRRTADEAIKLRRLIDQVRSQILDESSRTSSNSPQRQAMPLVRDADIPKQSGFDANMSHP